MMALCLGPSPCSMSEGVIDRVILAFTHTYLVDKSISYRCLARVLSLP